MDQYYIEGYHHIPRAHHQPRYPRRDDTWYMPERGLRLPPLNRPDRELYQRPRGDPQRRPLRGPWDLPQPDLSQAGYQGLDDRHMRVWWGWGPR
jgi:hypothetical protein